MPHWDPVYCTGKTLEWIFFLALVIILTFLLTLHCIMYKKINKRWSWLIFKRNRVQILTLSVLLTGCMFIKLTFLMDYADLVLLVIAQLLRFLIWSLCLLNFIKSATELVTNQTLIKFTIRFLKIIINIGLVVYIGYGITLIIMNEVRDTNILSCKNREFIIQSATLLTLIALFHYFAIRVTKEINA